MAKKSKKVQRSQSRLPVLLGAGALIVVAITLITAVALSAGMGQRSATAASPQLISANEYVAQFENGGQQHVLIDVRTPEEFASGHIAGAINIPVEEIGARLDEIPRDVPVVLYCRSGNRSAQAARILDGGGFEQVYDLGGIIDWVAAGYPTE